MNATASNPFRARAVAARKKADALLAPSPAEREFANYFPVGAGFQHSNGEKRITQSLARTKRALAAAADARHLEAQADAFDRDRKGRHIAATADKSGQPKGRLYLDQQTGATIWEPAK